MWGVSEAPDRCSATKESSRCSRNGQRGMSWSSTKKCKVLPLAMNNALQQCTLGTNKQKRTWVLVDNKLIKSQQYGLIAKKLHQAQHHQQVILCLCSALVRALQSLVSKSGLLSTRHGPSRVRPTRAMKIGASLISAWESQNCSTCGREGLWGS